MAKLQGVFLAVREEMAAAQEAALTVSGQPHPLGALPAPHNPALAPVSRPADEYLAEVTRDHSASWRAAGAGAAGAAGLRRLEWYGWVAQRHRASHPRHLQPPGHCPILCCVPCPRRCRPSSSSMRRGTPGGTPSTA